MRVGRVVAADEVANRVVVDAFAADAPFAARTQVQPAEDGRHIGPARHRREHVGVEGAALAHWPCWKNVNSRCGRKLSVPGGGPLA
ncbi:MAG TPA: hypothetical protein VFR86_20840, partial [Burkholderiaceae bacterium]|nr:hypothetical protein [Burkholderiaceae bacterium]